jgi:hypothetical protein
MEEREQIKVQIDLINSIAQRIHYSEERRSKYVLMATAFLAAGISIFAFCMKDLSILFNFTIFGVAVELIIVSLLILFVYSRQTNNYPFNSTNKKWFYRQAIPEDEKFKISFGTVLFKTKKEKLAVEQQFNQSFMLFEQEMKAILTIPERDISENNNQIFTLHLNEKYKNAYLSQLRNILTKGIWVIFFSVPILIMSFLFFFQELNVTSANVLDSVGKYRVVFMKDGNVREYINGNSEVEVLINITSMQLEPIKNVTGIIFRNDLGIELPYSYSDNYQFPFDLKFQETRIFQVWMSKNILKKLKSITLRN